MNSRTLNTQRAKSEISIVQYLAVNGHHPIGKSGKNFRYKSPFREEKEGSFFVDDAKGLWNDFGERGGSIIDLVMQIHHQIQSVEAVLEHLADYAKPQFSKNAAVDFINTEIENSSLSNIQIRPLNHFVLLKYLRQNRGISEAIAKKYLKLIFYDNQKRSGLFGVGWENDSGFWEIRSAGKQDFKAVTGTKDLTTILSTTNQGQKIFLFEGMLDFLSALMLKKSETLDGKVIILNSTSMIKKAILVLENQNFETIYTFLDNDKGGREALNKLAEVVPKHKIQAQTFYQDFNDVNEYWVAKLNE